VSFRLSKLYWDWLGTLQSQHTELVLARSSTSWYIFQEAIYTSFWLQSSASDQYNMSSLSRASYFFSSCLYIRSRRSSGLSEIHWNSLTQPSSYSRTALLSSATNESRLALSCPLRGSVIWLLTDQPILLKYLIRRKWKVPLASFLQASLLTAGYPMKVGQSGGIKQRAWYEATI